MEEVIEDYSSGEDITDQVSRGGGKTHDSSSGHLDDSHPVVAVLSSKRSWTKVGGLSGLGFPATDDVAPFARVSSAAGLAGGSLANRAETLGRSHSLNPMAPANVIAVSPARADVLRSVVPNQEASTPSSSGSSPLSRARSRSRATPLQTSYLDEDPLEKDDDRDGYNSSMMALGQALDAAVSQDSRRGAGTLGRALLAHERPPATAKPPEVSSSGSPSSSMDDDDDDEDEDEFATLDVTIAAIAALEKETTQPQPKPAAPPKTVTDKPGDDVVGQVERFLDLDSLGGSSIAKPPVRRPKKHASSSKSALSVARTLQEYYGRALKVVQSLKSENASLKARLQHAEQEMARWGTSHAAEQEGVERSRARYKALKVKTRQVIGAANAARVASDQWKAKCELAEQAKTRLHDSLALSEARVTTAVQAATEAQEFANRLRKKQEAAHMTISELHRELSDLRASESVARRQAAEAQARLEEASLGWPERVEHARKQAETVLRGEVSSLEHQIADLQTRMAREREATRRQVETLEGELAEQEIRFAARWRQSQDALREAKIERDDARSALSSIAGVTKASVQGGGEDEPLALREQLRRQLEESETEHRRLQAALKSASRELEAETSSRARAEAILRRERDEAEARADRTLAKLHDAEDTAQQAVAARRAAEEIAQSAELTAMQKSSVAIVSANDARADAERLCHEAEARASVAEAEVASLRLRLVAIASAFGPADPSLSSSAPLTDASIAELLKSTSPSVATLKAVVHSQKLLIDRLQRESASLREIASRTERESSRSESVEVRALEAELALSRAKELEQGELRERVERELARVTKESALFEQNLTVLRARLKDVHRVEDTAEQLKSQTEGEIDSLRARVVALQHEAQTHKLALDAQEEENGQLSSQVALLKTQLQARTSELESTTRAEQQAVKRATDLSRSVDSFARTAKAELERSQGELLKLVEQTPVPSSVRESLESVEKPSLRGGVSEMLREIEQTLIAVLWSAVEVTHSVHRELVREQRAVRVLESSAIPGESDFLASSSQAESSRIGVSGASETTELMSASTSRVPSSVSVQGAMKRTPPPPPHPKVEALRSSAVTRGSVEATDVTEVSADPQVTPSSRATVEQLTQIAGGSIPEHSSQPDALPPRQSTPSRHASGSKPKRSAFFPEDSTAAIMASAATEPASPAPVAPVAPAPASSLKDSTDAALTAAAGHSPMHTMSPAAVAQRVTVKSTAARPVIEEPAVERSSNDSSQHGFEVPEEVIMARRTAVYRQKLMVDELSRLSPEEFRRLSTAARISDQMAVVAGALCLVMGFKATWGSAQQLLRNPNFMNSVVKVDASKLDSHALRKISSLINSRSLREFATTERDAVPPGIPTAWTEILLAKWLVSVVDAAIAFRAERKAQKKANNNRDKAIEQGGEPPPRRGSERKLLRKSSSLRQLRRAGPSDAEGSGDEFTEPPSEEERSVPSEPGPRTPPSVAASSSRREAPATDGIHEDEAIAALERGIEVTWFNPQSGWFAKRKAPRTLWLHRSPAADGIVWTKPGESWEDPRDDNFLRARDIDRIGYGLLTELLRTHGDQTRPELHVVIQTRDGEHFQVQAKSVHDRDVILAAIGALIKERKAGR
jgi:colicin import membrane protein